MELKLQLDAAPGSGLMAIQHDFTQRVTGVFGPSGSGKTTLLETLAGLRQLPLTKGFISFNGEVWLDTDHRVNLPPERRAIGYAPQHQRLFPHWNARQNLLAGQRRAASRGIDFDAVFHQVVEALELAPMLSRYPAQLSGGERQRVALGRALCSGPKLLLLDEPMSALDHPLRYRILPFLQRIRDQFDLPIVIVSHQPAELQALCSEVVVLKNGHLIDRGPTVDIFLRPAQLNDSPEGYTNLIPAIIEKHEGDLTHLKLGPEKSGPRILIPVCSLPRGAAVQIRILAHEIIIAQKAVEGISARNCLPARIREVRQLSHKAIVISELIHAPSIVLATEVTPDAVEHLSLKPAQQIYLLVKSSSCFLCA